MIFHIAANKLFEVFTQLFEKKSIKFTLNCYGQNLTNGTNKSRNIKIFKSFKNDNIDKIYSKYDAFIFTSLTESFGCHLVEAARSGLPICSSIFIIKSIIKDLILLKEK